MVPSTFVCVDSLPLNANGKIDRRALAENYVAEVPLPPSSSELSPVEAKMMDIWREVLGMKTIGANDNFFELGGHSLLAVQIIARVRNVFGIPVPLRCIFEAPTVAGLAGKIAQYSPEGQAGNDVERMLREIEGLSEEEAQRLLEAEK
jgi:acyl carrier protein